MEEEVKENSSFISTRQQLVRVSYFANQWMKTAKLFWSNGMLSLTIEIQEARAQNVVVDEDSLTVDLADGRTIIAPLSWYPRLWHGTAEERSRFEIIGDGAYIHWPDLDEDLTVTGILAGRPSGERKKSLKKWLEGRNSSKKPGVSIAK